MKASIKVEGLTLSVPIFLQRERKVRSWAGMFLGAAFDPPRRELVKLLDNISFQVHEGDRVAILGRNGAGKSTLLRVLNGVYAPTKGNLKVVGSCQALLNMSLGFNGEATVRENIFLRGTAMGMKGSVLRDHIDPILEFSGLRAKASHRLRTLSTGQRMRLGFAISTTFQHDVILMDEWVGTGDAEFMAKATERMRGRVAGSKIVMLASHSVGLLRDICNKGIVLEQGRLIYAGDILPALQRYHDLLAAVRKGGSIKALWEPDESVHEHAYGCVESLSVSDGLVYAKGWCVSGSGAAQSGLVLVLEGVRYPATEIEHFSRADVMRHLGLSDDRCGFKATFKLQQNVRMEQVIPEFQMLAGSTVEHAHAPLRIAPSIMNLSVNPPTLQTPSTTSIGE